VSRLHDIGAHAWLVFVQSLNWIAVSLLGGVAVVHEAYPSIISGAVAKLPPVIGIPAILAFGVLVHYALRRAKKAGNG
jgi:hypothetical protein